MKAPSCKPQAPEKFQIISSKGHHTRFGIWSLGFPWSLALGAWCFLIGGCSFAPKYQRPAVETPAAFKELTPQGPDATNLWKIAKPSDDALRGKWWEMFTNAQLNALEEQVAVSNQNVAGAFANVLYARALVKEARAQLFPTLTASPTVTRSRQLSVGSGSSSSFSGGALT